VCKFGATGLLEANQLEEEEELEAADPVAEQERALSRCGQSGYRRCNLSYFDATSAAGPITLLPGRVY
jgi:hypothetical protein